MPDSLLIRASDPGDAVSLTEIERRVAYSPWSLSQFISACRSEANRVRVACGESGGVRGFAIFSEAQGQASLLNIAVHPQWQGQGLGRALLESVLHELRLCGAQRMVLEVRASNDPAVTLYRRLGFGNDGVRKNYYPATGGREDALLMSLEMEEQ